MKINGVTVAWLFVAHMAFCLTAGLGGCDDVPPLELGQSSTELDEVDDLDLKPPPKRIHSGRQTFKVKAGDSFDGILAQAGIHPETTDYRNTVLANEVKLGDLWHARCYSREKPLRGYCATPFDTLEPGDEIVAVWRIEVP